MNNPDFQFDHNVFGNDSRQVQSGDFHDYGKKKDKRPIFRSVFTVLLCVCFSFAAGFGGAFCAYALLDTDAKSGINAAPDGDSLYYDDPQAILDKSETQASEYGSAGAEVFQVSQVVRRVQDSVVVIDATVATSSYFGTHTSVSAGSGVIISPEGYILTCHHVVKNAISLKVTLNSGSQYEAALVGSDEDSDLAVLRIQPKESESLVWAEQGCSADLIVGEAVIAIGNSLGTLGGTVTDGIISAAERSISMSDGAVMTLIQTNAAINSGNSGGGLFNLKGELIGVVNAKYADEGVEGLAFAIPIDLAYAVELDLIEYGYVRGIVDDGLEVIEVTTADLAYYRYYYGIDQTGVYVVSSEYNEALKNKDLILSLNGTAVATKDDLEKILENHRVGDSITVRYSRDGEEASTTITLQEYIPEYYKDKELK